MVGEFGNTLVMADRLPSRVASDSDEFRISEPAARPVSVPHRDPRPVNPAPLEAVIAQLSKQTGLEINETTALLHGNDQPLHYG